MRDGISDAQHCAECNSASTDYPPRAAVQWLWTSRLRESRWTWTRAAFLPTAAAATSSNRPSCAAPSPTSTPRTREEGLVTSPHSWPFGWVPGETFAWNWTVHDVKITKQFKKFGFFKCTKHVPKINKVTVFSSIISSCYWLLRSSRHSSFQKSTRTRPAPLWTHRCRWRFTGWPLTTPERKLTALTTMVKYVWLICITIWFTNPVIDSRGKQKSLRTLWCLICQWWKPQRWQDWTLCSSNLFKGITTACIHSSCAPSTGFNPRWDCTLSFQMQVPDLALVRFVVEDHDHRAKNDFVGQFTLPFTSLRTGARACTHTIALSSGIALPIVAFCILIITTFLFRVSTCSFTQGRWLQSVPCNAFHPCQSDPQRSSHQERVRAHCNGQRQEGLTRIRK